MRSLLAGFGDLRAMIACGTSSRSPLNNRTASQAGLSSRYRPIVLKNSEWPGFERFSINATE